MLKLFNSYTRKLQPLRPQKRGELSMYNCGPTVYDYIHIGNLRSFLLPDLLRRFLEYRGIKVTQVMNITDVGHMLADADVGEDKVQVAAAKAGKTPEEITRYYTEAFFKDIQRIGLRPASVYPKASDHVNEMVAMIGKLLANGHAYKVEHDGGADVYFDVTSFKKYGHLSGNTIDQLDAGSRIEVRTEKRHPADFALWIFNPQHLMQWTAPWGSGYPGWHIECSAMATKYLGDTLDVHTGGEDNKFPHHECEIAQSEGATGKPFAKCWLHVTHLLVNGEKMSKSKGNFFTLNDLLAKDYPARAIRYLLQSTHYRSSLNFTLEGLDGAKAALAKLDNMADAVRHATPKVEGKADAEVKALEKKFVSALEDDLNVAEALAVTFEFARLTNERIGTETFTKKDKAAAEAFLVAISGVFGFTFGAATDDHDIPASIHALIEQRDLARKEKRWAESDVLRDELKAKGWIVEDTPDGRRIKRV